MKLKDWFSKISKQGKISNEDFNKFTETIEDTREIPDIFTNLFDQAFFTQERALADHKIYDTIRGEVLDGVKLNVKEYLPFLDAKDQEEISKEPKAFNQLKMLKDAFGRTIDKVKTENPSNDDKVKELQKVAEGYVKQLTTQKSEFENKEKELQKRFESEKNGMKLDWTLDKKAGEYTFADEYKEVKPHLLKGVLDKIKAENALIMSEDGQIQVHEKLESGTTKQKFINGNEPVTLEKLLEEPLKPFLKKNNKDEEPKTPGIRTQNPGRQTVSELDPMKMTLPQLRAAGIRI